MNPENATVILFPTGANVRVYIDGVGRAWFKTLSGNVCEVILRDDDQVVRD